MKKMDPEMVMEIPDTPERAAFTHLVGESSSHAGRFKDKPSSSSQYLDPTTGTSSCQMRNYTLYDFGGDNAAPLNDDILSQQKRINQVGITHSAESSSEPMENSVFSGDGASPDIAELSQKVPYPTRLREPMQKERKHLSRQSEAKESIGYGKFGGHDFNDVNTVSLDGDFLFSQASIARSISGTHDTRTKHSHDSSEPGRSGISNSRTIPKMIDLSQRSPFPVPFPTKHRGSRHREEKYLRRQSGRNEKSDFDKLGVRPLISSEELRRGWSNPGNSSNDFCSSNGRELESVRCDAVGVSSHKEEVVVKQQNSRTRNEQLQLRNPEFSFQQSIMQQNKLHNGCISPFDITITSNNGQAKEVCKEFKTTSCQRAHSSPVRNKVTETRNGYCKVSNSTGESDHNHINRVLNPKMDRRRMLVRNGCISPSNIAQNKTVTKDKGIEKGVPGDMPDSNSTKSTRLDVDLLPKNRNRMVVQNGCTFPSHTAESKNEGGVISGKIPIDNSSKPGHSSNFECWETDKLKGKRIMNEELANSQHSWTIPTSRRSCLLPGNEITIVSDMDSDSGKIRAGHTTGICASESVSSRLSSSRVEISKGRSLSVSAKPEVGTLQSGENSTQVHGSFKLDSEVSQHTGKRKNSFTHSNTGECSSSTVGSSSISCDRSTTRPFHSRTRSRKSVRIDAALAPIVEIDEVDCYTTEDNHELSDESIAKSIQLESDEILARQLQEQFYLESPPVGAAEAGSTIEWSLLQEEENLHASLRRQNYSHQREALLPSLFGQPRFHHPFTRMAYRARARSIGRIRRNFSRPSMSMEERIDFFEALEAAFENADMETPDRFLDGQRDFDENDYEMLLALDENNHHVGASERQINNLPQSLIQEITDSEEACAVCLETPSVGDTVRHLPCLHKFHKDCIDTWLRRKRSCPICKCGIT